MCLNVCVLYFPTDKSVIKYLCYLATRDIETGTSMSAGNLRSELLRNTCNQRQGCYAAILEEGGFQ